MSSEAVRVKILGSGAADHFFDRLGEEGVRGSAGTLIDGCILIDCGATGFKNLSRFGVSPDALTSLLITHSHDDHFAPEEIAKLIAARTLAAPLEIWGSPEVMAMLAKRLPGLFRGHPLLPGSSFEIGSLSFTALPANHQLDDRSERALHYLIETPHGRILYALDGAWFLKESRQLIGSKRLDLIIWDATMSSPGDFRIFEHNDLDMIAMMVKSFRGQRLVDDDTAIVLDHIALTLWPRLHEDAAKLATARGWLLAFDGMDLELRRGHVGGWPPPALK